MVICYKSQLVVIMVSLSYFCLYMSLFVITFMAPLALEQLVNASIKRMIGIRIIRICCASSLFPCVWSGMFYGESNVRQIRTSIHASTRNFPQSVTKSVNDIRLYVASFLFPVACDKAKGGVCGGFSGTIVIIGALLGGYGLAVRTVTGCLC